MSRMRSWRMDGKAPLGQLKAWSTVNVFPTVGWESGWCPSKSEAYSIPECLFVLHVSQIILYINFFSKLIVRKVSMQGINLINAYYGGRVRRGKCPCIKNYLTVRARYGYCRHEQDGSHLLRIHTRAGTWRLGRLYIRRTVQALRACNTCLRLPYLFSCNTCTCFACIRLTGNSFGGADGRA